MELIERGALLKAHKSSMGFLLVRKMIEEAPAIDAAPVVHGRLIHASCSHDRFEDCCKCSVCGTEYGVNYFGPGVNYCTCCGARMDGGGDNG